MTSLRKLILRLLACIFIVYALESGLLMGADQCIYHLRNAYACSFAYRYDDFLPYCPVAVMLILKLVGVKSQSKWAQMLVSTLLSFMLMGLVVYVMKTLTGVVRPDGSDLLSFPSGHTATAFTAAYLLYKEYGFRSCWIKTAAFLPATVTGLTRLLNNRHWLSDVMAGAAIGTIAVEIAYFLSGLLFRKKEG